MAVPADVFVDRPLIGRHLELGELTAALDDLQKGQGRFFLISGDPGIGKTRLLEALVEAAELRGVTAVWGRCWEGGGAPPYWPWTQVLRSLTSQLERGRTTRADAAAVLGNVFALAGTGQEAQTAPSASDLPEARVGLFDAVTAFLRARSTEGPLVVAFEDLHAADAVSLRLLRFVARDLSLLRLLIVGTCRDAQRHGVPEQAGLLTTVARHAQGIRLGGLDEGAVASLVERTTGGVRLGTAVRKICETTDGNPFFVQQVARLLVGERRLARDTADTGRLPVPREVRDLIGRRLEPLPADAHELLRLASVLGRHFDVGTLACLADRSHDDVLDTLSLAAELGVVEPAGVARWQFSHALLREALYDELEQDQRAALHRRAGEAIEQQAADDPASRAPQLAYHFFEAAAAGAGPRAVTYCALAAQQAMGAMAFEEAATLNGRALEALGRAAPVDEAKRYELLMALAHAQERGGDLTRARETFLRAVRSARALADAELLAQAAIGYAGFIEAVPGDTRTSVLEDALAALPPGDSPLRARLLVALANRMKFEPSSSREAATWNWRRGWQRASEGKEMALRLDDRENRWAALWDWHYSAYYHASVSERLAVADELVELAVAAGSRERLVLARQGRAADLFAAGDTPSFAAELDTARREADELRMPFLLWTVAMMQATLALFRGQLDEGDAFAREAIAFGERAEFYDVERAFFWQLEQLYLCRAQFQEYDRHTRARTDLRGLPRPRGDCAWTLRGRAAFLTGQEDEADDIYRRVVEAYASRGIVRVQACCPTQLAHLAWLTRADQGLEQVWEMLLPFVGTHGTVSSGHVSVGACDRYVALVAALQGRFDIAEDYFERAHRLHARMGTTVWDAFTRSDHAEMLVRRGRPADRDRARQLAHGAAERFDASGMHFWANRARDLVAPTAAPVDTGARLLEEGDYWTFHYGGQVARIRDTKGVRYLARLLRNPGQEVPATELAGTDDPEQARQSVRRAITSAVNRVGDAHPSLGHHLRSRVRPGAASVYAPDPRAPITWEG